MGGNEDLVARQVRDRDELEAALRLVHDTYVRCEYMQPQASGIRINVQYALPSTRTYVAVLNNEVVATVSLFLDSPLKLPLDAVFPDKADELRLVNRSPAEVGMLADRRMHVGRTLGLLLQLMTHVFRHAQSAGADDLLITVRAHHARFYQKALCFEPFAPARPYAAVANVPAELLRVRLRPDELLALSARTAIRELFLSPARTACEQTGYTMRPEDLKYFFVYKSETFAQLTDRQRRTLEECCPGLSIAELLESDFGELSRAAAVAGGRP